MPGGIAKAAVVTVAAQNDAATVTGLPSSGYVSLQVTGTFSGTITFEATVDNTNWVALHMQPIGAAEATATAVTTATAVGIWNASTKAYGGIRARCSTYTSGSPVLTLRYVAL
jgi:hypothetical protein